MQQLLFVLGRTPELAALELSTLFGRVERVSLSFALLGDAVCVETTPDKVLDIVGGTTKIATYFGIIPSLDASVLVSYLDTAEGQVVFGISLYDGVKHEGLLQAMKKELKDRGTSSRYIEARDTSILSSVVFSKEHIQELVISKNEKGYLVGKVLAVQPFEEWNKRDYGRPYADTKAGMLPPKVARMAVNIAGKSNVLLDPFCGMGTILSEALLRGASVVGSDNSPSVIEKTGKNLEWLKHHYKYIDGLAVKLFVSDATHISEHVHPESVDTIVTEPFMGAAFGVNDQLQMTNDKLKNIIKGLEKLYIGCLKDWYRVLKPGGNIVMALPQYVVGGKTLFVKKVIDSCENLGYTRQVGPIEYCRPQAVVRREFYLLKKRSNPTNTTNPTNKQINN